MVGTFLSVCFSFKLAFLSKFQVKMRRESLSKTPKRKNRVTIGIFVFARNSKNIVAESSTAFGISPRPLVQ